MLLGAGRPALSPPTGRHLPMDAPPSAANRTMGVVSGTVQHPRDSSPLIGVRRRSVPQ
jgi:hypothetical protein